MRLACALCILVAATAATFARPTPELRVADGGRMLFRSTAVPRSGGAAIGSDSFAFLTPRHGFAATTGGAGEMPKVGYQQPTDAGRIEETDDGGATWRTVWKRSHVVFSTIVFAGRRVGVAGGAISTGRDYGLPRLRPLLVATRDGGRTWHVLPRPPFPDTFFFQDMYDPKPVGQLQLPSAGVWYAFVSKLRWPATSAGLWRSVDGGRHWRRNRLPGGTTIVAFPSRLVGYAGAWSRACRTPEQLWKTTDGGLRWEPLPGTCGPIYTSVDFVDARRGFTSESTAGEFDSYAQHVVIRATSDGGLHWQTRSRAGRWWLVYTRLAFADARHGWATSDEWDQGFEHTSVHVTSDGGRTWKSVRYPDLPEGFFGASAWTGPWRTSDWGRTWRLSMRPDQLSPQSFLLSAGGHLVVRTDTGTIESRDSGRTWRTRPTPRPLELARLAEAPAFVSSPSFSSFREPTAYLRTRRGWRPLLPAAFFQAGAVAFRDARDGLVASGDPRADDVRAPVYRTTDGGRSWEAVSLPPGVQADTTLLVAPGVIAIPDDALFVSVDGGRQWRQTAGGSWCGLSRPTEGSIWILCGPWDGKSVTLLKSDDAGAHWRRLSARAQVDASKLVATGPRDAWVVGVADWARQTGAPLWHTTDGGRTWHEVWPRLGPGNRVYDLRPS